MRKILIPSLWVLLTCASGMALFAQEASTSQPTSGDSTEGTVISSTRQTMVVRSDDNQFHLFTFENASTRPKGLTPGARVRVESSPTDEAGVRMATRVSVLEPSSTTSTSKGPAPDLAPPPSQVREAEHDIERQVRKWRLGFRVGAGLDPELFSFGVHSQMGPVFSRDFYLRPNAEFGFGELTDFVGLNLEGAYRLPLTSRQGRWSAYVGAGPSLNFIHQGVDRREISFGNFEYQTGFNLFTGLQFRRGTFVEVKTSLWAKPVPALHLIFGYTF